MINKSPKMLRYTTHGQASLSEGLGACGTPTACCTARLWRLTPLTNDHAVP